MQTNPPPGMTSPPGPVEPTTRERMARYKTLTRRALTYWKVGILLFVLGCGAAVGIAMTVKRTYRSECVILVKPGILLANDGGESPEAHSAKQSAKLKEALTLRSKLEGAIKKFKLYPKTVDSKGMLDAVDEMRPHVGFRARDGGTYVVSFDSSEVDGQNTQDLVRDVTQYLSEQLIEEYATGNLGDLKMRADFLQKEQSKAEADLEKATQLLTVFLSQHPEFAMEAKQAAASNPFGMPPNPAMGIPLMPKQAPDKNRPAAPTMDPALAALYGSDAQLGALYRQRARLEAELKNSTPATNTPVPVSTAGVTALQEQVNAAQAEVEAAAKRAAETQADVMSKQASLSPEHPDMKAAQANADVAARQLHQAKVKLATLQQQLHIAQNPGTAPRSDNPYETGGSNPELVAKLKEIASQIGQREAELKSKGASAQTSQPVPPASGSASGAPAVAPSPPVSPLVALETEWQRLLRGLSEAKASQDGLRKEYEKAQMGVKAQQAAANDLMQVIEAAYRPTHPAKGGRTPVAIGGALAALLIALLYMAGRVAFNDTLIDSADIEALNLIPVLGIVPKIHVTQATAHDDRAAAAAKGGRVGAV